MSNRAIKDTIKQLAGTFNKDMIAFVECTVSSVNAGAQTCDCVAISGSAETEIPNVKLSAEANDGVVIIPKVDSTVIVGLSSRIGAFVAMFEDLDSYQIVINETKFLISDGLIKFNDGSFGGLTKSQELKTQLDKTNDVVNTILTILTGSPVNEPGNGAPSALQATLSAALAAKQVGDFSDIENEIITHGE